MNKVNGKIRKLLIKALKGNGAAYRKLGIVFLEGKKCKKDRLLAKLCLDKAAEMGDEQGYLLYHREFTRKKKVIDDLSFVEICRDYREAKGRKEKRRLKSYLKIARQGRALSEKKAAGSRDCQIKKTESRDCQIEKAAESGDCQIEKAAGSRDCQVKKQPDHGIV